MKTGWTWIGSENRVAVWRVREAGATEWSTGRESLDNLSEVGWSWGCVSAVDSEGRTIWIADANRGDGNCFVAQADEKLTALLELESAIPPHPRNPRYSRFNDFSFSSETVLTPSGRGLQDRSGPSCLGVS